MFSPADTIVAIATPAGRGGLGVVRLAGPDAVRVAMALVGRPTPFEPRRATFARIVETASEDPPRAVDQVVVTWFAAPNSYTGDDVVEISGHGSPLLLARIVDLAMRAGARLAEPGEFTFRAYLNNRLDLVQAEAIADIVDAVTPIQARAAMDQLEGTLTRTIGDIDRALFDLCARLDASLDFPDEGFHFITRDAAASEIARVRDQIARLLHEGNTGRIVREGRLVVIVGRPNAGKSSLFNALAGAARAIVTEIPGTTRDILTDVVDMEGIPVTLVDTAGIRATTDIIEAEGVARARQAMQVAALTLIVLDGSSPLTSDDRRLLADCGRGSLIAISKSDLPSVWGLDDLDAPNGGAIDGAMQVSALTGVGLAGLRRAIAAALVGCEALRDVPRITNLRHVELLGLSQVHLDAAATALETGATEELVLVDLNRARGTLEEITGRRTPDDVLTHIFARFCVGK
jgi:tRNA modification GTPase